MLAPPVGLGAALLALTALVDLAGPLSPDSARWLWPLASLVTVILTVGLVQRRIRCHVMAPLAGAAHALQEHLGTPPEALRRHLDPAGLAGDLERLSARLGDAYEEIEKLALVARYTSNAVIITDARGLIEWTNAGFSRITGYGAAEVLGRKPGDFLQGPATDPAAIDHMREQVRRGQAFYVEAYNYAKDGTGYWVGIDATPIHDARGRLVRFIAIESEISARIDAENRLRQSEHRLRDIAESIPGAVFEWRYGAGISNLTYMSSGARAIYGLPAEQLRDHPDKLLDLAHPEDRRELERVLARAVQTRSSFAHTYRLQARDESARWVRTVGELVRHEDNALVFTGITTDITRHQEARNELQRTRDFLNAIVDSLPMAVFAKDPDTGRYVLWNRFATELFGLPAARVIGATDAALFDEEQAESAACADAEALSSGDLVVIPEEVVDTRPHGRIVLHTRKLLTRDTFGRPLALLGIAEDVSERLRVNTMLRQRSLELSRTNQELIRVAQMKDEFLAAMSHELRTPLNSVLALAEVLQESVYGEINERQRRYLQTIESSGRHLLSLINDVLDVSKIEAGHLELELGAIDIRELTEASLRLVRQVASKKGITLQQEIRTELATLQGDERRLKQVLVNLLANAVKFTADGGRAGLLVDDDPDAGTVAFTVWDSGIGIAAEQHSRLFQPFVQVDGSLSRGHEGTGLGLTLVRRLTELHHGSVTVQSVVGEGSRFTITLPLAVTAPAPPLEAAAGAGGARRPEQRLLVAEDSESGLNGARQWLEDQGWEIVHATDGLQAVDRVREGGSFEAIVLDAQLSVMGGIETLRALRAQAPVTVPIVAVATVVLPGDQERYLEAGADHYLPRPLSPAALGNLLDDLRRKRGRRAAQPDDPGEAPSGPLQLPAARDVAPADAAAAS